MAKAKRKQYSMRRKLWPSVALVINALFLGGFDTGFLYLVLLGSSAVSELLFALVCIILGLGVAQPWIKEKQIEANTLLLMSVTCISGLLFGWVLLIAGVFLVGGLFAFGPFTVSLVYYAALVVSSLLS